MPSVLFDRSTRPEDSVLFTALGRSATHWRALIVCITRDHPRLTSGWKYYGPRYGWRWRAAHGRRTVLSLNPHEGSFTAAVSLSGTAPGVLRASMLPSWLVREIETARAYADGRPARVLVTSRADVDAVRTLVSLNLGR